MHSPSRTAILVFADNGADARQAVEAVRMDHAELGACVDAAQFVPECDEFAPEITVLAFRSMRRTNEVLEQLYGGSRAAFRALHKVLLLVYKDDVRQAFDLCRNGQADDYVQYWPIALDGYRLRLTLAQMARAGTQGAPSQPPRDRARRAYDLQSILATPGSPASQAQGLLQDIARQAQALPLPAGGPGVTAPPWATASSADAAGAAAAPRTVLLVDDDRFQFKLTRTMLAESPVQLQWMASGADALRHLMDHRPDVVLMDIDMPLIDGIETVRRLRLQAHLAEVPVIMLTGHSDRNRVVQSLQAGASGFIVKPFSKKMLLDVLGKHISQLAVG